MERSIVCLKNSVITYLAHYTWKFFFNFSDSFVDKICRMSYKEWTFFFKFGYAETRKIVYLIDFYQKLVLTICEQRQPLKYWRLKENRNN